MSPAPSPQPPQPPPSAASLPPTLPPRQDDFGLPRSDLAVRALRFAEAAEPAVIFRHSVRSYLFARELATGRGLTAGADFDDELVFLGCVLHDLGLSEQGNGDQRFEVDGADLAARFLRDQGVDEQVVATVWDTIALHTSDGITSRQGPEVALAQAGIAADILGRDKELLPDAFTDRVHAAFPREDLAYALTDLVERQALANPAKAGPLSFPGQVVRGSLPHGTLPTWYDLIAGAGWGDRPPAARTDTAAAWEPGQLPVLFERFLDAGDLDALVSLYEPHAVLAPAPGSTVTGPTAIAAQLRSWIECGVRVTFRRRALHTAGDLALLSHTATVTGPSPDGTPVTRDTAEVARRQPDGRWLYAVDDPFFGA
ncbi:nuclear transport factor 2 family protein [Streptomyces celluloflavus]|uniref:nuclear transport factor 2 family protein n=1 Tax=Streptomyces celluloflavus TaxID=58344 RepID=UPI00367814B4